MKKLIAITIALGALHLFAEGEGPLYVIEKVNKGTHFLKPGQTSAGFLTNNEICGAKPSGGMGSEACAVVTPTPEQQGETKYYLQENVFVTGTPAPNLVGFIEGSITKGVGVGGDKGTGVFRLTGK
jgi:hypothetical protein